MGFNHAACGLLAGLASLPFMPLGDPASQLLWVIGASGAALVADLDTTQSSGARMWGPLSGVLAGGIGAIAGGHRQGTHDLCLAPLAFGGLAWLAMLHPITAGMVLMLLLGLSLRALTLLGFGRIGAVVNLVLSGLGAYWLVTSTTDARPLVPIAIALGVIVHIVGDWLTAEGVPIPVVWLTGVQRRLSVGLFQVGSPLETFVVAPILSLGTLWLLLVRLGVDSPEDVLELAHQMVDMLREMLSRGMTRP